MRVGLVVSGGVDRSGRDMVPAYGWLIERLARRHDVRVFALHYERQPLEYPFLGATVYDLGTRNIRPGLRRWTQRRRLATLLDHLPPLDVLHAWWAIPAGWVATAVARPRHIPVIVTASSGEFIAEPSIGYGFQRRWLDRRLVRVTMRRAAAVTVATHYMRSLAAAHDVNARVVPHGVPSDHVVMNHAGDRPPWRLIHVAHRNAVKDQPTLLRAFQRVLKDHPDSHLDIVGGDALDGRIERLARAMQLTDRVTFHGAVSHPRVRALLSVAHLHVLSSRHEAAAVSVLDAAAAGVPTVGTAVGYVAEWAPTAASAVGIGDDQALASAIEAILSDPTRRRTLARTAQERAAAYSADDMVNAFDGVYHAVTTRRPGSAMP